MKKKICFVSQFPPPIHGLSKAVDTLYNSKLSKEYILEKVDITSNFRILINLLRILFSRADIFYFTISQSKNGNIRDLLLLKLINFKGKKCVVHLHGGYYRKLLDNDLGEFQRKINIKVLRNVDRVIVLGESLKNIFEGIIDEEKICVVHNCVDNEFFNDNNFIEDKVQGYKTKEYKNVLYLSNFIKSKGYMSVLELAKMERENTQKNGENKLKFDFAGKFFNEEDEKEFFEYVQENDLTEIVKYHGIAQGDLKKELLTNCDFFCLISRYPKEGQPISILEAMANGSFIITTDHSGIPDIVTDEENGILLKEKDKMDRVFWKMKTCDSEEYTRVCRNNVQKVEKNFSEKKYIESMLDIFSSLV